MRKMLALLVAVFGLALAFGAMLPQAEAGPCKLRCICGVPNKCCTVNGVETCTPDPHSHIICPLSPCQ
jgi:hypothetical protein